MSNKIIAEPKRLEKALAKAFDKAATTCSTADLAARHIIRDLKAAGYQIVLQD